MSERRDESKGRAELLAELAHVRGELRRLELKLSRIQAPAYELLRAVKLRDDDWGQKAALELEAALGPPRRCEATKLSVRCQREAGHELRGERHHVPAFGEWGDPSEDPFSDALRNMVDDAVP